jgi:hypothetical protein
VVAGARSYTFYASSENSGIFRNETGLTANALILTFAADVEILEIVCIGGDLTLDSSVGGFVILKGTVPPFGSVEVVWAASGPALQAATWRTTPFAMHRIDVVSPTADLFVLSQAEEFELGMMLSDMNYDFEMQGLGSTDPDGEIVKYLWEWSDGVTDEGVYTTRNVANLALGHHVLTVTLTVIENDGNSDSVSRTFAFDVFRMVHAV